MAEEKSESKTEIVPGLDVDASGQVKGEANKDEVGQSASANVGATEGGKADGVYDKAHEQVGVYEETKAGGKVSTKDGLSASGGAVAGDGVTAGASGTVGSGKTKVDVSTDVSIGDQIGATGGCHATMKDGVISVGVKGAIAAGLGLKGDVDLNIDTNAVQKDGKSFVHSCNDAWDSTFGKL
tara:strand:+ start:2851 stop:3396 length:546 start_codon:yes stop_codon:yes gene_type:complete